MPELLLELLSEEIPARLQARAAGELRGLLTEAFAVLAAPRCHPDPAVRAELAGALAAASGAAGGSSGSTSIVAIV